MNRFDFISEELGGERNIHYSLDRFRLALNHLGNPQREIPSFVIGGTNGKGSTALFFSSGLVEAGFKVITFLSPHLHSPAERILLNLKAIEEEELESLAREYLEVAAKYELTYFEFFTLLYFMWAIRKGADFLVLEVGMGGRLDATNVTDPIACAITNIGFDHQAFLGNTKQEILTEKLGILPAEGLLFSGVREPELLEVIEDRCAELDSIYYYSKDMLLKTLELHDRYQKFSINAHPFQINCPLLGFQENAALAFLMLRIVFPRLSTPMFQKSFARVCHPGRFEVIQENPRVILSGDHNLEGVENLLATLKQLEFPKVDTICAFSPDKPYIRMASKLKEYSNDFKVGIIERFKDVYPPLYYSFHEIEQNAMDLIEKKVATMDKSQTLLITGSLYFVAEARKLWKSQAEFLKTPPTKSPQVGSLSDEPTWARPLPKDPTQIPVL